MKKIFKLGILLASILLLSGCGGPSIRDVGKISITLSPLFVIFVMMIVLLYFKLVDGIWYFKDKKVIIQFLVLLVIGLISSIPFANGSWEFSDALWSGLLSVPPILFLSLAIVVLLPRGCALYSPVIVTAIYYTSVIIQMATNNPFFGLPLLFYMFFWITIPSSIVLLVVAIRRSIKRRNTIGN